MVATLFFVSGRVQGVFFRASTQTAARRLGINGWAMNLADGRVEVLAVGTESAVAALGEWLQHGPPGARVDALESVIVDSEEYVGLDGFSCGRR